MANATQFEAGGVVYPIKDAIARSEAELIENSSGVYRMDFTQNGNYPYFTLPLNAKSGDCLHVEVLEFNGDLTNVVSFYMYDISTAQTIGDLSITGVTNFIFSADAQNIRFIMLTRTEVTTPLYMKLKCYIYGQRTYEDISKNMFVYAKDFTTTAGQQVIVENIPMYAETGDVIEFEIIDTNNVLSSNAAFIVGYKNNGTNVNEFLYITKPFTIGRNRISTGFDMDSIRVYVSSGNVVGTGTFSVIYKNMTKLGIEPKSKSYSSFSILGDSYSTFIGYTNPTTNRQWYPTNDSSAQGYESGNNVTRLEHTWWYIIGDETELYMKSNASYSGSTVCYDSYGTGDADGKTTSFIQRAVDLEKSSLILVFGGTNDYWAGDTIGDYIYSNWTEADLSKFAPGLSYLINELKHNFVGSDIAFIENDILSSDFKTAIETVCAHYNVPVIKLQNISKTADHPNTEGMRRIANYVKHFINNNVVFPYYE